jgi:hypothetical protein
MSCVLLTSLPAIATAIPPLAASSFLDAPFLIEGSLVRGVADLTGDGKPEFLVVDSAAGSISLFSGSDGARLHSFAPAPNEGAVSFGSNVCVLHVHGPPNAPSPAAVDVLVADSGANPPIVRRYVVSASGATPDGSISGAPGGRFGFAMSYLGDIVPDGRPDFAISDPHHGGDSGAVWIHSGADLSLLHVLSGAPGETFGWSISSAEDDLSGDGAEDFVVGAPGVGSGQVGRAYVFDAHTFAQHLVTSQGDPGACFGWQVVNLAHPPVASSGFLARFAVSAPYQDDRGAVFVFQDLALMHHFRGETIGGEFGRLLGNAYNTKQGGSNEIAVADKDSYFVYSAALGLLYYDNPLPDEVLSFSVLGHYNGLEDNYPDTAILHRSNAGGRVEIVSGKTLFFKTKTLFAEATSSGSLVDSKLTANAGGTHAGRPFLLLCGSLLDPNFTGNNQNVNGTGFYFPIDLSSPISAVFATLPPYPIPTTGILQYQYVLDSGFASLAAQWAAANQFVFVGLIQTGTTLAVTNPVPVATLLGG